MNKLFLSKKFVYAVLFVILALAAFIRLYSLGLVPPSPDWDEAALGYNAYSILHTGKDEYGKVFPVVLRSFDDYKPALYAYLVIPSVQLFGLNVFAVRLPAALSGILAVALVFFIIRELFKKEIMVGKVKILPNALALTTTLLFALSPWHIQFSRIGFEAGVGLTLNLLVVLCFLKGLRNRYGLVLATIFGALNLYMYQSEKVYTPLLFIILILIYRKELFANSKKWLAGAIVAGLLVALPMLFFIVTNPDSLARAKGVSVFSDSTKLLSSNLPKIEKDTANNDYLGILVDNRRVEYVKAFVSGYISHMDPNWLFYMGDVARHHAPYMGQLYIFTLPFILVGLYILIFSNIDRKTKYFVILFFLIAPIPASITIDVPHAVRTINYIPVFDLLAALGLLVFAYWVWERKIWIKLPVFLFVAGFIAINITYFFNQYFVQLNYYDSKYWQYGWKEAVEYVTQEGKKFDHVVVSNEPELDQSYIFFLFYTKYDPAKYLSQGGTKTGGFDREHSAFENYIFRPINWEQDKLLKNTLFVGRPEDLPVNIAKTVYYLNGDPAIIISRKFE